MIFIMFCTIVVHFNVYVINITGNFNVLFKIILFYYFLDQDSSFKIKYKCKLTF